MCKKMKLKFDQSVQCSVLTIDMSMQMLGGKVKHWKKHIPLSQYMLEKQYLLSSAFVGKTVFVFAEIVIVFNKRFKVNINIFTVSYNLILILNDIFVSQYINTSCYETKEHLCLEDTG